MLDMLVSPCKATRRRRAERDRPPLATTVGDLETAPFNHRRVDSPKIAQVLRHLNRRAALRPGRPTATGMPGPHRRKPLLQPNDSVPIVPPRMAGDEPSAMSAYLQRHPGVLSLVRQDDTDHRAALAARRQRMPATCRSRTRVALA